MTDNVPDYITDPEIEDWFDSIDAAVFSGDAFDNKDNRDRAIFYISRWLREFRNKRLASNMEEGDDQD